MPGLGMIRLLRELFSRSLLSQEISPLALPRPLCLLLLPHLLIFFLFPSEETAAMAVQAQCPANLVLLNRADVAEMNSKEIAIGFPPLSLLEQSPVFFLSSSGGIVNPRKRLRKAMPPPPQQQQQSTVFSLQSVVPMHAGLLSPAAMLGLAQLQLPTPQLVSTGLRLAFDEQTHSESKREQTNPLISAFFAEEVASQINQQKNETEQFLAAQGEQLRQDLAERRQRQYQALLSAAEKSAAQKLREKTAEVDRAARRNAELEDRLARLHRESMAWQAKAMEDQAAAASLNVQLEQAATAAVAGVECCGESPAEDAGSAYVDSDRPEPPDWPCQVCRRQPASVVLFPCRHLCLCAACDSADDGGNGCPACGCLRAGSLQVFFS